MKIETEQAIKFVVEHLQSWKSDLSCNENYVACNDITVVIETLNKLPELEIKLGYGGLVRDAKGNWLQHEDNVSFYVTEIHDGVADKHLGHGRLIFTLNELTWFILSDNGDWYHLGEEYGEISSFWKEESNVRNK